MIDSLQGDCLLVLSALYLNLSIFFLGPLIYPKSTEKELSLSK